MPPNNQFLGTPGAPQPAPGVPAPHPVAPLQAAPSTPPPTVGSGSPQTIAKPTPKNPNATQQLLQLSELREGMVIMADGSFRAVIRCQSINFDLMSAAEREGVEFSYQNFLNSLNFPVQIVVRSERIDIGPYLDRLEDQRRAEDNMLLGVLMDDYINFIDQLAQEANIMEKSFYVVVPFFPQGDAQNLLDQGKGFFSKMFAQPKKTVTKIDKAAYQKAKEEIANRVASVLSGLFQIGIQSVQLNTKELGELYYNFYNPDTAVREPLGNFNAVTSLYTKKAAPGAPPLPPGGNR